MLWVIFWIGVTVAALWAFVRLVAWAIDELF